MALQKNKGHKPEVGATPKEEHQPDHFNSVPARCFLCGTRIDAQHDGYGRHTAPNRLFNAWICWDCVRAMRHSQELYELSLRRYASVTERLTHGEPLRFDGITFPQQKGGE